MTDNPFAPPELDEVVNEGPVLFPELSWLELKARRRRSRTLDALGWLWLLVGSLIFIVSLAVAMYLHRIGQGMVEIDLTAAAGAVVLIGAFATHFRPAWARFFCFMLCGPTLVLVPFGTVLAVCGMVAIVRGRDLFGADRKRRKGLEQEFRHRRKYRIFS